MEKNTLTNSKILDRNKCVLLVIDIQEKILKVMHGPGMVTENTIKLIKGMKINNIPVIYTEQYPKGLGGTLPEIKAELEGEAIQKMSFSCSGAGDLFDSLKRNNKTQVVVCGIEAHVCVQQTVLDLLANGFQVDVIADAVSSRRERDYMFALDRMRANGAEVTTTESALFEVLTICGTDEFKAISKLVK